MPSVHILVDSSFLYALFDHDDTKHQIALSWAARQNFQLLVPQVVLSEVMFLLDRAGGVPATLQFLDSFTSANYALESITIDDLLRVREIRASYASSRLDFVDCCIMALSERLQITQVCTFDRRDFVIFRPRHCDYLDLLP
ncbi:MAG: PIN domain-containing protein [Chloroflexi bacterium]|nr:PIN domain-containing protein [Chloroflexota bacterium]